MTRERLEHLYTTGTPIAAIAVEAGVSVSQVHRRLRAAGIPPRGPGGRADWTTVLTPRMLRAAVKRGETAEDIAGRVGAPDQVVRDRLRRLGMYGNGDKHMAAAYQAGESLSSIATRHRLSVRTVARRVRESGVDLRPPGRPRAGHPQAR